MEDKHFNYKKIKKKYFKFISSQEVMSEPFRNKLVTANKLEDIENTLNQVSVSFSNITD